MAYQFLLCEEKEDLAIITLNRPEKRNALSKALREEIILILEDLEKNESVRVVVLTGAGPSFCAGFDLGELAGENAAEIFAGADAYHQKVYTFPKPLIGAVNGPALAGGMDLAVMCDIRVASEEASFGQPQVRAGIPVAYDLVRTVLPEVVVRDLCLTGRRLDAQEAWRVGLVKTVVSGERLMDEAFNLAREVAGNKGAPIMKRQFINRQPHLYGLE